MQKDERNLSNNNLTITPARHNHIMSFNNLTTINNYANINSNTVVSSSKNKNGKGSGLCCTCQRTHCIKRYCNCYSSGKFCVGCDCKSCYNGNNNAIFSSPKTKGKLVYNKIIEGEQDQMSINSNKNEDIDENFNFNNFNGSLSGTKNVISFANISQDKKSSPSVYSRIYNNPDNQNPPKTQTMCNCTKSNCSKRYCECFKSGKECSSSCRCLNCVNKTNGPKLSESKNKIISERGNSPGLNSCYIYNNMNRYYFYGTYALGIEINKKNGIEINHRKVNLMNVPIVPIKEIKNIIDEKETGKGKGRGKRRREKKINNEDKEKKNDNTEEKEKETKQHNDEKQVQGKKAGEETKDNVKNITINELKEDLQLTPKMSNRKRNRTKILSTDFKTPHPNAPVNMTTSTGRKRKGRKLQIEKYENIKEENTVNVIKNKRLKKITEDE